MFEQWKIDLAAEIVTAIKRAKRDGCIGMSMDCLRANTRIPQNGPGGVNARYMFKNHWFPDAFAAIPKSYQKFVCVE